MTPDRPTSGRDGAGPPFSCRVISGAGRVTLSLHGELDVMGAAQARLALLAVAPSRGGWLVIDLRGLSFMDSTGVRLILQAMDSAERHGATLAVIRGPSAVQRALEVVGLAEQLLIVDAARSMSQIDQGA